MSAVVVIAFVVTGTRNENEPLHVDLPKQNAVA